MRDRLIELLKESHEVIIRNGFQFNANIMADYLLANGVIVPPCKVGGKLYATGKFTGQIVELTVECISIVKNDIYWHCGDAITVYGKQQLGKTVFFTKEEAEQALNDFKEEIYCEDTL